MKKKMKKTNAPASKAPAKAGKAKPGLMKSVLKAVTQKVKPAVAAKTKAKPVVAAKEKAKGKAAVVAAPKKVEAKKAAAPVAAKVAKLEVKGKLKAVPALVEAKPAKGAKVTAKGKEDVVLEMPSPKGIKNIVKAPGKKAGKAAAALANAKKRCREPGCDHDGNLSMYCRMHYIKNWRKIKRKEAILASGQLNNYVEELVNKYPDKYLEVIRQDLASEKDWSKVVVDLELESDADELVGSDDEMDSPVPEGGGGGARREKVDFEDDGDAF